MRSRTASSIDTRFALWRVMKPGVFSESNSSGKDKPSRKTWLRCLLAAHSWLCGIGLICVVLPLCVQAQSSLDSGPWPTQGHDNQRTSQSAFSGPTVPGMPQVIYDAGKPVGISQIVVTSDGKILLTGCVGEVVALNSQGQPYSSKWPFQLLPTTYPSSPETPVGITVSSNGTIYVASHECPDIPGPVPTHFYAIRSDGTEVPNWPIVGNAMYWPAAIGNDGTIYQMDELQEIHAFSQTASLLWAIGLPSFGQGDLALDSSGNVYVGTDANLVGGDAVYSFTSTGGSRNGWPEDTGGSTAQTAPVISTNGNIYIANFAGSLYAFSSSGALKAGFPFVSGGTVSQQPLALSSSGTVYMKTSQGLYAINPDGSQAWPAPFSPGGDASLSPGPILDSNGNIDIAFGNSVYSLNSNGTLRNGWPVTVPNAGSLVIGGNGILYVVSGGQKLYSISTSECSSSSLIGTLQVFSNLSSASFSISGACTYSGSGTTNTFQNAPGGRYTITFNPTPGYTTPFSQTLTLASQATAAFVGYYQSIPAAGPPGTVDLLDGSTLLSGSQVITDPTNPAMATKGIRRDGVAADGVARLVVRFNAPATGTVFFSLTDTEGNALPSSPENGHLTDLQGAPLSATSPVPTSSNSGYKAFAIYIAPSHFVRANSNDDAATSRSLNISIRYVDASGSLTVPKTVAVGRPPVFLVHGIWSCSASWDNFMPLVSDTRFLLERADYRDDPNSQSCVSSQSLATSAAIVYKQLVNAIHQYQLDPQHNFATAQADVIAHSMGAPVVRTMALGDNFLTDPLLPTFGAGPIHKLITIGGAHLGSPLATFLLNSSCLTFAFDDLLNLPVNNGAVSDLEPNSTAITSISSQHTSFPVSTIVGIADTQQEVSNGNKLNSDIAELSQLYGFCFSTLFPGFDSIFGGRINDLIIPADSQAAGGVVPHMSYFNVIHTGGFFDPAGGFTELGEGSPGLTPPPGLVDYVIELLNANADDTKLFQPL